MSYNIFELEPAAELLLVERELKVGIIVSLAFNEGYFRRNYLADNRLERAVERVEKITEEISD